MSTLYDFDEGDLGEIFPQAKKLLSGTIIIVHGVSEATFDNGGFDIRLPDGTMKKNIARSLLWNFPCEPGATESESRHWGLLLSEDSLPISKTKRQQERGHVPFSARITYNEKISNKNQGYWNLERVKIQFDAQGNPVISRNDLPPIQFDNNGSPVINDEGEPVLLKK